MTAAQTGSVGRRAGRRLRSRERHRTNPQSLSNVTTASLLTLSLLPVFFELATLKTNVAALVLQPVNLEGQAVHIGIFVPPLMAGLLMLGRGRIMSGERARLPPPSGLLLALAFTFATCAVIWAAVSEPALVSFERYIQTVLVTSPLVLGLRLKVPPSWAMQVILIVSSLSSVAIVAFALRNGGTSALVSANRFQLNSAFPQILIYLPFLSIVAASSAIIAKRTRFVWRLLGITSAAMFLSINYSRATFILAGATLLTIAVITEHSWLRIADGRKHGLAGRVVGGIALATLVVFAGAGSTGGSRLRDGLSGGRSETALEGLKRAARSPLLGEGFIARSVDDSRPFDAHNQFIDYVLRAGIMGGVAAIVAIVIVARTLRKTTQRTSSEARELHLLALTLLMVALIGGFANVYLTQPFPGILIWLLVGLALGDAQCAQPDRPPSTSLVGSDINGSLGPSLQVRGH